MVTTETHQTQDLLIPTHNQDLQDQQDQQDEDQALPSSPLCGFDPEKMSQGPVNAITVLTLLDKLVNMLDTVQENQHKMEVSHGRDWGHTWRTALSLGNQYRVQQRGPVQFGAKKKSRKSVTTRL